MSTTNHEHTAMKLHKILVLSGKRLTFVATNKPKIFKPEIFHNSENKYIRFDWAMKQLHRNKPNFAVLADVMLPLLNEPTAILKMSESNSYQESEYDKYNRAELLAELSL